MARVTLNPLVEKISGSVGSNITFACRKRTTTVYGKKPRRDAKSPAQLAHRERYKAAVAAWKALTPAQRAEWDAKAAALNARHDAVCGGGR